MGQTCGTHCPAPVGIFVFEGRAVHACFCPCLPSASRSLLPSPHHNILISLSVSVALLGEHSTKVGEQVNGLSEVMSLQILSPNLILGR